jgi:hypothetical protein
MEFTDEIAAAFPTGNKMPAALEQALRSLEEHGCVRQRRDGVRYMTLHPEAEYSDVSATVFYVPDAADTKLWTGCNDPEVNARLTIFLRTGGDGSWAGLWRDDAGRQKVVHLGSGSGSVMLCVLTENIEDLLRLLAIGYDELCWPEHFHRTPAEVRADEYGDDDHPPPPAVLRNHVSQTLGLSIPERAAEIISHTASMDASESDDPFWNWLKHVRGE